MGREVPQENTMLLSEARTHWEVCALPAQKGICGCIFIRRDTNLELCWADYVPVTGYIPTTHEMSATDQSSV